MPICLCAVCDQVAVDWLAALHVAIGYSFCQGWTPKDLNKLLLTFIVCPTMAVSLWGHVCRNDKVFSAHGATQHSTAAAMLMDLNQRGMKESTTAAQHSADCCFAI